MTSPVTGRRGRGMSVWLGLSLAAFFFYPLAAALDGDPYYLQWQPVHAAEAFAALLALTVVFAAIVHALRDRPGRAATVALASLMLLPLMSLGAGISRQVPFGAQLRLIGEQPLWRYGLPVLIASVGSAAFVLRPALVRRMFELVHVALSPIAIVVVIGLARSGLAAGPVVAVTRQAPTPAGTPCRPVLALLFDEFSFAYLYEGRAIRPEFPNIAAFAAGATNYLDVRAPGETTIVSVPGYLAGSTFDEVSARRDRLHYVAGSARGVLDATLADRLMQTARRVGLSPEVAGYYLSYCELLGHATDACRALSFYNAASVDPGFSLMHPVLTTLILWPRQLPFGLLKNRAFVIQQRGLVDETERFVSRPLAANPPAFRLAHFSVPHLPFAFDQDGYNPPFDPLRQAPDDAYVRQLRYVDRLFGGIVQRLRRNGSFDQTTIAFFSDHGFRSGGRESDVRHVPFIVKSAMQTARLDVADALAGEVLLNDVVTSSCPSR